MHAMIIATEVDGKYEVADIHSGESYNYLVREIVRDKESGGRHDLYRADGITSYDPVIGRLFRERKMWEGLMEKNRGTMDKTIAGIEAASKARKIAVARSSGSFNLPNVAVAATALERAS